jgi:uncharacterized protein YdeI (YjbR/CyaY-like superfamily)
MSPDDLPVHAFDSADAWERWLSENHETAPGVWLKLAKVKSGIASVKQGEAVEVALCYGWIDGQARPVDETGWMQRYTPRRAKSVWSKVNREKVAALTAAGRMQPAGLKQVELAKADGRWEAAYDPPSRAEVPADLQHALEGSPEAAAFFAELDGANRYAILHRLQTAKRPETRARRIEKFVGMLERRERLHP